MLLPKGCVYKVVWENCGWEGKLQLEVQICNYSMNAMQALHVKSTHWVVLNFTQTSPRLCLGCEDWGFVLLENKMNP